MQEISIYYDREKKKEVEKEISFGKIMAGKTTKKILYIQNNTRFFINIKIILEGESIKITKDIEGIRPRVMEKVEIEFKPKADIMKPIKAKLKIKFDYIVR